jgi:hypothetical protein
MSMISWIRKSNKKFRPPRWITYSTIQTRASDIGPWRVEVTDEQGALLQILRFSIVE